MIKEIFNESYQVQINHLTKENEYLKNVNNSLNSSINTKSASNSFTMAFNLKESPKRSNKTTNKTKTKNVNELEYELSNEIKIKNDKEKMKLIQRLKDKNLKFQTEISNLNKDIISIQKDKEEVQAKLHSALRLIGELWTKNQTMIRSRNESLLNITI